MTIQDFTRRDTEQKIELLKETGLQFDSRLDTLPKNKTADDARSFPRKAFAVPIDFAHKGRLKKANCANLSYSGIYINLADPKSCQVKDRITMTFLSSGNFPFILNGTVVRKEDNGIGVRFRHSRS